MLHNQIMNNGPIDQMEEFFRLKNMAQFFFMTVNHIQGSISNNKSVCECVCLTKYVCVNVNINVSVRVRISAVTFSCIICVVFYLMICH